MITITKHVCPALLIVLVVVSSSMADSEQVVRITGWADASAVRAEEAATEHGLQRAVAAIALPLLDELTESARQTLVRDVVLQGYELFVVDHEMESSETSASGQRIVRLHVTVAGAVLRQRIVLLDDLLERKGTPSLAILRSVDGKPFDARLTAVLQRELQERGLTTIDIEQWARQRGRDVKWSAQVERNLEKAALISEEAGADVLAVVELRGQQYPAEQIYGLALHSVDAVGIVRLIRADTAEAIASETVERRVTADTESRATRQAAEAVMVEAMRRAAARIAEHWLGESVTGPAFTVVAHEMPYKRLAQLIDRLRQVGGVRSVTVRTLDPEALSFIHVQARAEAMDLADVLTKIDRRLEVIRAGGRRIDVR